MRTVITIGTFDLFHHGHVELLKRAASFGTTLYVGLNRDNFVARFKGKRPIMSYSERAESISACRFVDQVIANEGDEDCKPVIERTAAGVIVVGSDWLAKDYLAQTGLTEEWLRNTGRSLVFVPYTDGISTSKLIQRITNA